MLTDRVARGSLAGLAVTFLLAGGAACAKKGDNVDSAAARTDSAATATSAHADSAAAAVGAPHDSAHADSAMASRGGWTPASVLGYTTAANTGEIEEARLAEKKATNPAVKAYARELLADHETLLSEGKSLATKLKVAADTVNGDAHDLVNHTHDEIKDLTDKKAGADWDEDFINKEIDGHQHVLDKLQDAAKNTTDADLRAALEKATGKVQQHLTKAQDIKANKLKK